MRNLAILVVALTACTSARHMRAAQDEFSRATTAENAVFGTGMPPDARSAYRTSLSLVDAELAEHEARLREESLLGTALTLKAMCEWRLADLEDNDGTALQKTIDRIRNEGDKITLGERDRVMVRALPGFRDNIRARLTTDYAVAKGFFADSLKSVEQSLKAAPKGHPMRLYIKFAQLSMCRTWQSAALKSDEDLSVSEEAAKVPLEKALALLNGIKTSAPENAVARNLALMFKQLFGFPDSRFEWKLGS